MFFYKKEYIPVRNFETFYDNIMIKFAKSIFHLSTFFVSYFNERIINFTFN